MVYIGPSPEYGPNWNRQRWVIFKAYGYICQMCGRFAKGNLQLHHKIPIKISHDNSWNNLIPLCSSCHGLIHKEHIKLKEKNNVIY